jgi:hypothetical protein
MGMAADSIHSAGASSGELTKQQENHDQLAWDESSPSSETSRYRHAMQM